MAATTGPRKTVSIYDYPEHLNPFREEDNHNKIRFWTIGRKLNRSNSISFSGIKDLKNSWALRSFMKKGKKSQETSKQNKLNNQVNGENSPIIYRRALQYSSTSNAIGRSTVGSPERADRYVYGGSVTPLPRSRFQERLRSPSQHEVNSLSISPRMARSDVTGSRLSVESTNPFDEGPVPPVRASRRKKKRAPMPPSAADISVSSTASELQISELDDSKLSNTDADLEIEKMNFVELQIVEDDDLKNKNVEATTSPVTNIIPSDDTVEVISVHKEQNGNDKELRNENDVTEMKSNENITKNTEAEGDILKKVSFPKVDIVKYRRNSSLNEDDIRLRRGNLEDFHVLSNKRSKSLSNTLDQSYLTYDINLNKKNSERDQNGNEEPQKVICKLHHETIRKQSIDNSISSTEREFIEIDKATRELEKEIRKLNSALTEDDIAPSNRLSVSEIKRKFDKSDVTSPNPIPKPRRSHYGGSISPVNDNYQT